MNPLYRIHSSRVHPRRVQVLARHLAALTPAGSSVLDIGCGDGLLAERLAQCRPDLQITGIDVLVRPGARIPVVAFDGRHISQPDRSVDVCMFIDVLHHSDEPEALLREARRVTRRLILIKDHNCGGWFSGMELRFMDRVGNARYGVHLPHNYLSRRQWDEMFRRLDLQTEQWVPSLGLYGWAGDWLFGRSLHFIAALSAREDKDSA
jgi:SAM-dependent methyltransferase